MSSSNSPCAACKCLRRKCTQECVFAPYFPPDQPQKFINVHKVFGASNVAKLLNDLNASHREDAVQSLAFEAHHRLRDPVYGCVGQISLLQQRLKHLHSDLAIAKKELATYLGQSQLFSFNINQPNFIHQQQHLHNSIPSPSSTMMPYAIQPIMTGIPTASGGGGNGGQVIISDPQQHHQQIFEAHQMAAAVVAREQQDQLIRSYEQQQPGAGVVVIDQAEYMMRYNNSGIFDTAGGGTASPFNQMAVVGTGTVAGMSSSPLIYGSYEDFAYHQMQQQPQPQQQPPSDTSHLHGTGHA